eukprot:augustus_masked-scaffold_2-processed-gene-22.39-mRNA-1 protein AED:0.45 eAED:0.45 QI:0/-1/0/1/-1/1/1/0/837
MLRCGTHKAILRSVEVGVEVFEKDVSSSIEHQFVFGQGFVKSEATYSFPLDSYAAVCGFEAFFLDGNNKTLKHLISKAKEKEEARQEFEQAKVNGQTAQLLENDTALSGDRFTISLGNIPAECKIVKTNIQHLSTLEEESEKNASRLTIPSKLATRYISEDLKLLPEENNVIEESKFKVNIILGGTKNLSSVSCLTHQTTTEFNYEGDSKKVKVSFAQDEPSLEKDMILKIVSTEETKNSISIQNNFESENTEFSDSIPTRIRFVAKIPEEINDQSIEKDFIFLIDRSGSMSGSRMNDAKKALQLCLSSLPENASFDICSFGSNHSLCFGKSVKNNNENLSKARDHVKKMSANLGGTEIQRPLKMLIDKAKTKNTVIFLLTDGSIYGTSQLINEVQKDIKSKPIQMFTCGIGNQVSKDLVKGLAEVGRGTATFIAPGERMNAKIIKQLQVASATPAKSVSMVQENISLHSSAKLFNNKPPEVVFDGDVVDMFTMLNKDVTDGQLKLVGTINKKKHILAEINLSEAVETKVDLFKVAARAKVKQIERRVKELKSDRKTALKLAIAANLVSKYTSLVSVDVDKPEVENQADFVEQSQVLLPTLDSMVAPGLALAAPAPASVPVNFGGAILGVPRMAMMRKSSRKMLQSAALKKPMVRKLEKNKKKREVERVSSLSYSMKEDMELDDGSSSDALFSSSLQMEEGRAMKPLANHDSKAFIKQEQAVFKMKEEKAKGKNNLTVPRAPMPVAKSPEDVLDELVLYQNTDGSFSGVENLVQLLQLSSTPDQNLMTAIVVVYLETKLQALKDEWKLIYDKAMKFLGLKDDMSTLLEKAREEVAKI